MDAKATICLNRVRKFLGLLHTLELVLADGRTLNKEVFARTPFDSTLHKFPLEYPTPGDFWVWESALREFFPGRPLAGQLGPLLRVPHQVKSWFASEDEQRLYYVPHPNPLGEYDVFECEGDGVSSNTRRGRRYCWRETRGGRVPDSNYALVMLLSNNCA